MFTKNELKKLDRAYFKVQTEVAYHIIVKSINTGHIWDIESVELYPGKRCIVINHKHNERDVFHRQLKMHPKSLVEAQNMIKCHDAWHLKERIHN